MDSLVFEEDFIYTEFKKKGKLILRNCKNSCGFCPASKLKCYSNISRLNSILNSSNIEELKIYGNCNSSYIESVLLTLKRRNIAIKIHVFGCSCNFDQNIEGLIFHQLIHPEIEDYRSSMISEEYIVPATGDPEEILLFAQNFLHGREEIPAFFQETESAEENLEFWSSSKIEEIQRKLSRI